MEHKGFTLSDMEELLPAVIFGAEGEGEGDSSSDSGDNGDNGEDAGSDSGNADEGTNGEDDKDPAAGLKSALQKERARANRLEKEAKARAKADEARALAEKSEIEQAQIKLQQAEDRAARLSTGYVNTAIERAIEKAASEFIDPDDAIQGVDRKAITFEQDDEDPSIVKVDAKSVKAAVDALAKKKSHLLKAGTNDGEPTGGQFGGSGSKKKSTTEDELRAKYPSL